MTTGKPGHIAKVQVAVLIVAEAVLAVEKAAQENGDIVGEAVETTGGAPGLFVGVLEGVCEGDLVGVLVGALVGDFVGVFEGALVGDLVGLMETADVGTV